MMESSSSLADSQSNNNNNATTKESNLQHTVDDDDDDNTDDSEPSILSDRTIPWAIDMDGTLIHQDVSEAALAKGLICPYYWPVTLLAIILYYGLGLLLLLQPDHPWRLLVGPRLLEYAVPLNPILAAAAAAATDNDNDNKKITWLVSIGLTKHDRLTLHMPLLNRIVQHRKAGGQAVLATASHVQAAKPIVQYAQQEVNCKNNENNNATKNNNNIQLFDDILGSNPFGSGCGGGGGGCWDLKGAQKADALARKYQNGFVYAGNSADDLNVWSHPSCRAMILVNVKDLNVLAKAKTLNKPYIVLE